MSTATESPKSAQASEKLHVSEEEARALAEESRETDWVNPSFMKEMFLGNFRFDLIDPYPEPVSYTHLTLPTNREV